MAALVTMFLQHRETYGMARLLLADDVGVGKTLSLAASAMVSALLDDGPVLILCPATLTMQWQVELADKLGIPSAVWSSTKKLWLDPNGHEGPKPLARPSHFLPQARAGERRIRRVARPLHGRTSSLTASSARLPRRLSTPSTGDRRSA